MAKKTDTQAKKKAAHTIPNIVSFNEFLKLRGEQKAPLTIYFNEQEWKTLTKGVKPVEGKLPKKGIRLALFASPSIPGGFGTLSSGGSPFVLAGRGGPVPPPPGPGDRGQEKPDPGFPVPDPKDKVFVGLDQCRMIFSRTGPHLQCAGECLKGRCRQVPYGEILQGQWRVVTITCEC